MRLLPWRPSSAELTPATIEPMMEFNTKTVMHELLKIVSVIYCFSGLHCSR